MTEGADGIKTAMRSSRWLRGGVAGVAGGSFHCSLEPANEPYGSL